MGSWARKLIALLFLIVCHATAMWLAAHGYDVLGSSAGVGVVMVSFFLGERMGRAGNG